MDPEGREDLSIVKKRSYGAHCEINAVCTITVEGARAGGAIAAARDLVKDVLQDLVRASGVTDEEGA